MYCCYHFSTGYSGKIVSLEFDPASKTFRNVSSTSPDEAVGDSPSFIGFSPDGQCMLASNEVSQFRGRNHTGSVTSFKVLQNNKHSKFRKISTALTAADPVAVAVSPDGSNLMVAEYTAGSWSRYGLNKDCSFVSEKPAQVMQYHGSGPNKTLQDHSYLHQVTYNHVGNLVFLVDRGGDSVYIHRVDRTTGHVGQLAHQIQFPAGSGPRHLSITGERNEYDIYVISEISNQIFTIRLWDQDGKLQSKVRQRLDTLPPNQTGRHSFAGAEVMASGDGRFVYGSNRQTDFTKPVTDNSMVVFRRDTHTGLLARPTWFPLQGGGKTPRHFSFSLDPYQSFLIVGFLQANRIAIFHRRSSDGALVFLAATDVQSPAVQLFIPHASPSTQAH